MLKWNWSTLWLTQGLTNSCHRNWKVPLSLDDFNNFHNLPYKIGHRESMLKGEWPHSPDHLGCGYCKNAEDAGGVSDRQYMTETQLDQTPDELMYDPTATHVTPAILEVFVNNVCNLGCTYCASAQSSVIEADAKKYKDPAFDNFYFGNRDDTVPTEIQKQYFAKLINWLKINGNKLKRFHILGGEPFYQVEFDELLEVWYDNPNPNLVLNVVSNFNVKPKIFQNNIKKIQHLVKNKKIERFDLTASLDCWGTGQEYVRRGFKSKIFEENMLYALADKSIRININSTHTLMSIEEYPNLLQKKSQWEKLTGNSVALYGMIVNNRTDYVHPALLGGDFFKNAIEKIRKSHPVTSWDDRQAYKNINAILSVIEQAKPDLSAMKHFLTVYNELDRRHGTNWKKTFPRIAQEINKHIIL